MLDWPLKNFGESSPYLCLDESFMVKREVKQNINFYVSRCFQKMDTRHVADIIYVLCMNRCKFKLM